MSYGVSQGKKLAYSSSSIRSHIPSGIILSYAATRGKYISTVDYLENKLHGGLKLNPLDTMMNQ
jgi:hypothetical protein